MPSVFGSHWSQRAILSWGLVIAWAALIFLSSAQSNAILSSDPTADFELRKLAHLLVFGVLAVLLMNALRRFSGRRVIVMAVLLCAAYAASDEFHQAFVATRGPRVTDVLIDIAGAAIGVAVWHLLILPRLRRHGE